MGCHLQTDGFEYVLSECIAGDSVRHGKKGAHAEKGHTKAQMVHIYGPMRKETTRYPVQKVKNIGASDILMGLYRM
jgi:hypothetical protein